MNDENLIKDAKEALDTLVKPMINCGKPEDEYEAYELGNIIYKALNLLDLVIIENATLSSAFEILVDKLGIKEIFPKYDGSGFMDLGEKLIGLTKPQFEILNDARKIAKGDK